MGPTTEQIADAERTIRTQFDVKRDMCHTAEDCFFRLPAGCTR
jgi:hypothetical protein